MNPPATSDAPAIRIGTSGYSFKDWVGPFYPTGLPAREMLTFYAREFDAVEINFTYYRLPTAATLASMADKTPTDFVFFIKAHETFTHKRDLTRRADFLDGLEPLRKAGKLAGLLFQFPQSWKNDFSARAYLVRLANAFRGYDCAVEFRDRSWASPTLYTFLAELNLSIVAVDEPSVSTLFPRDAVVSGDIGYVRFHSRDGSKWYRGGAERYDYFYSEAELREWVPKIERLARRAKRLYVFFNNCHRGQAVENAKAFRRILSEAGFPIRTPRRA